MSITDELIKLDPTLIKSSEGHWNDTEVAEQGYHSFNDAGIECETGELLYGLIKVLQPERVLETGTHWGIGTAYMAMALRDNHKGVIDTIEFLPEIRNRALARFEALHLTEIVRSHLIDAAKFQPPTNYDFILLDTEPGTRFAELIKYYDFLKHGGYIFIHDLHRHMHQIDNSEHGFAWPYGPLPDQIKQWVKEGKLRPFHFGTPRGLTGFYKVDPGDYSGY